MEVWVVVLTGLIGGFVAVYRFLKRVNEWFYVRRLGEKRFSLPPGDMGWPYIGNMLSFFKAFKSSEPDSFISGFVKRFGRTGIYRAFMFGRPIIMVTTPETCKQVLMDDERFKTGWPETTKELIGRKSFVGLPDEEHKRMRKLTAASISGHEALSVYLEYIEDSVVSALEEWSLMGEIEFLYQLRRLMFRVIMYIFLSKESSEHVMEALEMEYAAMNHGVRAMAINLPGFAYYKALKSRKKVVAIMQSVLDKRRTSRGPTATLSAKKDMMDALIDVEDENGRKLDDEEIIDLLIMYLNAGHESSSHASMWTAILLQQNPEFFQKAKAEQEEIVKKRPPEQKGLTLEEIRKMDYLSKVINETLRVITISWLSFREAKTDVNIGGFTIPKGWRVGIWIRSVHMDPEVHPLPREFNPSRWEGHTQKAGTYIPFGAGSRLCPGNELAKLEISVFLHYFLLNYQLDLVNPTCPGIYLPNPRPADNCRARIRKISAPSV